MKALLVATLVLGALLAACSLPDSDYFGKIPDELDVHHLRWCNQGEPDYLDPALASSTVSVPIVSALFAGLTAYGQDGLPIASLATRWEISPDLRTYTFHLRDDARWSNGRAVTAYDVAYGAIRTVQPLTGSPNSDNIAPLKNAMPYLARHVYALRRAVGPYRVGDIVELVPDAVAAGAAPVEVPELAARTSTTVLALRDLGAPEAAAYANVPAGAEVTLVETSGGRATPPAPDGTAWAYVFWPRDQDGVFGWIPAAQLDGEPNAGVAVRVRAVAAKFRAGEVAPDAPGAAPPPIVDAHGADLLATPDVLGIRVPDPHTIIFECADPTPFFLGLTDNRALRTAPIEAVSRWPRRWTHPEHIITSGPLMLTVWRERDVIELVRSPTYWNQAEIKLDRVSVYAVEDQAAATNLYYTGACDATASNDIPSTYLPMLNGEQRRAYKDYSVAPFLGIYFAWLNTKVLTNRHLRRALSLAIDRTQIPRFTHGGEIPTAQLTPGTPIAQLSPADLAVCGVTHDTPGVALIEVPGEVCYVPPPGLDYDLAAAQRELAAARTELGAEFPTTINYRYNAGSEAHKQIAEYLQSAWKAIGVDVTIESQEFNSLLADTMAGNYQIARLGNIGSVIDAESEFLSLFKCDTPDNRARYCSADYERLMTEARTLSDRKLRNAKLREAEAVMIADLPVLPLYVYTQKHLIKPYVRDLAVNLIDQPSLWRVSLDPDWRAHLAAAPP